MRLRRNALGLLACALALAAASARAGETVPIGETEAGELLLDFDSQHDHRGYGYENISGRINLRSPVMEAGRAIHAVEVTLDFDCAVGRYRVMARTYLARNDEYVRTEIPRAPWIATPRRGAIARAERLVCPEVEPYREGRWPGYRMRRGSEAQVVELPTRPGAF